MNLFCIPYAGSSSSIYANWKKNLSPSINLYPIELAGRGKKIHEEYYEDFQEAVSKISDEIFVKSSNEPYAIFGHSMGGLLTYEVAKHIFKNYKSKPVFVFISGINPPKFYQAQKISALSDQEFLSYINGLGGIPKKIMSHPELINFFLPILKSDFLLLENYSQESNSRINCRIITFAGMDDNLSSHIEEWKGYTNKDFKSYEFKGGHFFINQHHPQIINIINKFLKVD